MKTFKSMIAVIALLFSCAAANATVKTKTSQPTQNDVVNTYINAITKGQTNGLEKVLGDDMQFNLERGQNVNTLNKDELVNYLKNNTLPDDSVSTVTTVLQSDDTAAKIKIEFKFPGYVRIDVVTLKKSFGWKIINVNSTFS